MNYGYKKEEIQIRKMTMAELRLGIVQELLKKNYRYVNIRLVNTTCTSGRGSLRTGGIIMGYVLTFIFGGMVGILLTCLMQVKR